MSLWWIPRAALAWDAKCDDDAARSSTAAPNLSYTGFTCRPMRSFSDYEKMDKKMWLEWGNNHASQLREGFSPERGTVAQSPPPFPEDARIDYNRLTSPEYSQTVTMPIVAEAYPPCSNFCSPATATCAKTKKQCSSDADCAGCVPAATPQSPCVTAEVRPYEDAGKLGSDLAFSSLTNGYAGHEMDLALVAPGANLWPAERPYQGVDKWEAAFNEGLRLFNRKMEQDPVLTKEERRLMPKYPTTTSATGIFYNTTPSPANIPFNLGPGR